MFAAFSKAVKDLDSQAISGGIPSLSLMERAAYGIFTCAENALGSLYGRRIVVFCGSGNNGGDGVAFCRIAQSRGALVRCILTGDPDRLSTDMAAFLKLYSDEGGSSVLFSTDDKGIVEDTLSADLIIDAIYGIGFHGELTGNARLAAQLINRSSSPVISADLPSGAETDSALISTDCVKADYTVSFTCLKPAHCIQPAKTVCGKIIVWDIGIPKALVDSTLSQDSRSTILLTDESFLDNIIPKRKADTHKGHYGKVLVAGGCVGFTGAPYLAAAAACRTGSGLVYLAVPESIYTIEASRCGEIICMPFSDKGGHFSFDALEGLLSLAEKCDVCVIGPGLGRSEESDRLVHALLEKVSCPVILDADGINALAENINILHVRALNGGKTILTPHDVEFARLGGDLTGGRLKGCAGLTERLSSIVVLKGNTTITASPEGKYIVNTTGNPGMAKGGSGDVLAGIIGSLAGQHISLAEAAAAGVFIHGAAGNLAAERLGEYGMLPSDIISDIPNVLKKYNSTANNNTTRGGT